MITIANLKNKFVPITESTKDEVNVQGFSEEFVFPKTAVALMPLVGAQQAKVNGQDVTVKTVAVGYMNKDNKPVFKMVSQNSLNRQGRTDFSNDASAIRLFDFPENSGSTIDKINALTGKVIEPTESPVALYFPTFENRTPVWGKMVGGQMVGFTEADAKTTQTFTVKEDAKTYNAILNAFKSEFGAEYKDAINLVTPGLV